MFHNTSTISYAQFLEIIKFLITRMLIIQFFTFKKHIPIRSNSLYYLRFSMFLYFISIFHIIDNPLYKVVRMNDKKKKKK